MKEIKIPIRPGDKKCNTSKCMYNSFLFVSWDGTVGRDTWGGSSSSKLAEKGAVFSTVQLNDATSERGLPAAPFHSYPALNNEQLALVERCLDEAKDEKDFYKRVRGISPLGIFKYGFAIKPPRLKDITGDGILFPASNLTQQIIIGPRSIPKTKSFGMAIRSPGHMPDVGRITDELHKEFGDLKFGAVMMTPDGEEREFGTSPYTGNIRLRWDIGGDSSKEAMWKAVKTRHESGDLLGALGLGFNVWYRTLVNSGHQARANQLSAQLTKLRKGQAVDLELLNKIPAPEKKYIAFGF